MSDRTTDGRNGKMAETFDDHLERAGLPLTDDERERLKRQQAFVREWVERLRIPEIRYAQPVLTYDASVEPAAPPASAETGTLSLEDLRRFDAMFLKNNYGDEILTGILESLSGYVSSIPRLRGLPLGEVKSAFVMHAGGRQ